MRIVVNDLAAEYGGAMTILKQFYSYLCDNDHENEWIFLLSGDYLPETENIQVIVDHTVKKSQFHKLWFDFVGGKKIINQLNPDVVLSLQNIITFGVKVPQYVYIHQSIPFQNEKNFSFFRSKERRAAIYQHLIGTIIKLSAKKADGIIVQTQWMRKAVLRDIHNHDKKCLVALPDVPKFENKISVAIHNNQFFYPTNGEFYKNDALIEEACKVLDAANVNEYTVNLTLPTERKPKMEHIQHLGRLTTQQMQEMYAHCVLVFPSYIETVGLPLLEAMQVGTVILAADCEYAHEILDGYENAYFFSPWKSKELANLLLSSIRGELSIPFSAKNATKSVSSWEEVVKYLADSHQNTFSESR